MMTLRENPVARTLCALMLLAAVAPAPAAAAPAEQPPAPATAQDVEVSLRTDATSFAPDDDLRLSVTVTTTQPAEYLEARLRMRSPSGRLVWQKTEVRPDSPAGAQTIDFGHDLASLGLGQGRYPVEVRVLASGADPTSVTGRVLVVDPADADVSVVVVAQAVGLPAVTMGGALATDPSTDVRLRDDLALIARRTLDHAEPVALAVAPVLLEQLARVSAGYETTAGARVEPGAETPVRYAQALDSLGEALASGSMALVDVPYALPDISGLDAIDGGGDLALHWIRTDTVRASVLRSAEPAALAYLGESLTADALASAAARGAACVLAPGTAVRGGAAPGCYGIDGSDVRVVVVDERASAAVADGPDAFTDALFDRIGTGPVVVMLPVGGAPGQAAALQRTLDWLEATPWVRLTDAAGLVDEAARAEPARSASLAPPPRSGAPAGYWEQVAEVRGAALAYAGAVAPDDPEASAALRAALVAESALWSGPEGDWHDATFGLSLAGEALDFVTRQFSNIQLDAKDVTLSGSTGDVPLTLINGTGKHLTLSMRVESASRTGADVRELEIQPTQNFITVPVDLGNALSDRVSVSVWAGGVMLARTEVAVRASYIDRLATVGMVVVVLAVLLVFIRRRVRAADAATIVRDRSRQGSDARPTTKD